MATRPKTTIDLLGPDISGLWDAFDNRTIIPSGGPLSQWSDESVVGGARPNGTPVNGKQTDSTKYPTYLSTGLAGKPAVKANGSQYLDLSPISALPVGQSDLTMFALIQAASSGGPGNQVVMSWGSNNNGFEHLFGFNNDGPHWWYTDRGGGSGDIHGTSDVSVGPTLCILSLDNTGGSLTYEMRVNGTVEAKGTGNTAVFGSDGGRLFYTINDYCNPANCAAGVMGAVRRIMTLDEKQQLESILLFRQGVQTATSGPLNANNNPYYAAAPTVTIPTVRRRSSMLICS